MTLRRYNELVKTSDQDNVKTTLYMLLEKRLDGKEFIELKISELQAIAGDDWLLEVSEQALQLNLYVAPHPSEPSSVLVARSVK